MHQEHQEHREHQPRSISRTITDHEKDPEHVEVEITVTFKRYYGNATYGDTFAGHDHPLQEADAIAICYDMSKLETLHNAIYKVCTERLSFREFALRWNLTNYFPLVVPDGSIFWSCCSHLFS
jgi:hypothetical protein